MFTLLFWNMNRRPLGARLARIARGRGADLVALAECRNSASVTRSLNAGSGQGGYSRVETSARLTIYVRFSPRLLRPVAGVEDTEHFLIRELEAIPGVRESILIATAHLPSKLHGGDDDRTADAREFARAIAAAEDALNHTRTVLVGDLNINPFEPGIVNASALHGVMTRAIARDQTRSVNRRTYRYFYNPMWRFFGDGSPGPPGSYHYRKGGERCYFWNLYDQVLVRPALLDHFPENGVEIVDSDGETSLLAANGRPDPDSGSDHLPIFVQLDI